MRDRTVTLRHIRASLLNLANARGTEKSFCPSEVARELALDWRPLMQAVRTEASKLCRNGQLIATQHGEVVDADMARGPVRFRQNPESSQ
ncbi:MAG: DUF3253 domain-containing protein [Granulosicoccus sp.]